MSATLFISNGVESMLWGGLMNSSAFLDAVLTFNLLSLFFFNKKFIEMKFLPHRPQLVKGTMKLFSVDQQRNQALEGHAATFATLRVCISIYIMHYVLYFLILKSIFFISSGAYIYLLPFWVHLSRY